MQSRHRASNRGAREVIRQVTAIPGQLRCDRCKLLMHVQSIRACENMRCPQCDTPMMRPQDLAALSLMEWACDNGIVRPTTEDDETSAVRIFVDTGKL